MAVADLERANRLRNGDAVASAVRLAQTLADRAVTAESAAVDGFGRLRAAQLLKAAEALVVETFVEDTEIVGASVVVTAVKLVQTTPLNSGVNATAVVLTEIGGAWVVVPAVRVDGGLSAALAERIFAGLAGALAAPGVNSRTHSDFALRRRTFGVLGAAAVLRRGVTAGVVDAVVNGAAVLVITLNDRVFIVDAASISGRHRAFVVLAASVGRARLTVVTLEVFGATILSRCVAAATATVNDRAGVNRTSRGVIAVDVGLAVDWRRLVRTFVVAVAEVERGAIGVVAVVGVVAAGGIAVADVLAGTF